MNINKLHNQLTEGTITKGQFLQQVRNDSVIKTWITPLMSYDDVMKVLKRKNVIAEVKQESKPSPRQSLNENMSMNPGLFGYRGKGPNPEDTEDVASDMGVDMGTHAPGFFKLTPEHIRKVIKGFKQHCPTALSHIKQLVTDYENNISGGGEDMAEHELVGGIVQLAHDFDLALSPNWDIVPDHAVAMNESVEVLPDTDTESKLDKLNISPDLLAKAVRIELAAQTVKNVRKATKKAISNLTKDPIYYVKKEAGEKPTKKKPTNQMTKSTGKNLVDKANQMKKAKINENEELAQFEQDNEVSKLAKQFVQANPELRQIQDQIRITASGTDEAEVKFNHWEPLPNAAVIKLELQFDVEKDTHANVSDHGIFYILKKKQTSNSGTPDLGGSFDKFKDQINELVKKTLNELMGGESKKNSKG